MALGDSTDNDWSITGIQLEVGEFDSTTIPSFQHESYGDSLQRCERYCKAIIKEASYACENERNSTSHITVSTVFHPVTV